MESRARTGRGRPGVRRFAWPVVICTTLCALVARPAYADPSTPGGVPDPGVPPVASAPLVPGSGTAAPSAPIPPDVGPFAKELFTLRSQVESLSEQLDRLSIDLTAAQQATASTYQAWQDSAVRAADLKRKADAAATDAYKQAT